MLIVIGIYWFYPKSKPAGLSEIKTIAILPFEDLSESQTEKYLGVSLADALANKFSELKGLTVRPTRSVLKYAESREDLVKIGRELQVDAVLDGRISHVGERIRISVQLICTSDNATIWTGNFDDQFTNFFAVQDSISQKVVQRLALQINNKEREKFNKHGTENAEAYQDYLRGRYFWNKRTGENLQKAITNFEQATQKDPNFALAFAGLADCYILLPEYYASPTGEAFPKAKAAINRALELDDQSAEVYTALAYSQAFYDWNFADAENSFKRAIELNPNYATAHQWYSEFLFNRGRIDESFSHIERALQIDPTSMIIMTEIAANYYYDGKYEKAVEASKKVIETDPNFSFGYFYLGFSYEHLGNYAEASENFAKTMTLNGEPPECVEEVREAFRKNGMKGWWEKRREQFEKRPHLKFAPAFSNAIVYARVGDKEKALEWLNKSYEQRERWMVGLKYAVDLDSLREEPRFQDLLRRMGY
ncbi:hypothetical protein BH10ACI1_BH10ACI1_23640 [soil metagenome]